MRYLKVVLSALRLDLRPDQDSPGEIDPLWWQCGQFGMLCQASKQLYLYGASNSIAKRFCSTRHSHNAVKFLNFHNFQYLM